MIENDDNEQHRSRKTFLARGPDEPQRKTIQTWPAGRRCANLARGPDLGMLCTYLSVARGPRKDRKIH